MSAGVVLKQRLVELLRGQPWWRFTAGDVARRLGTTPGVAKNAMMWAVRSGWAKRPARGFVQWDEKGRDGMPPSERALSEFLLRNRGAGRSARRAWEAGVAWARGAKE